MDVGTDPTDEPPGRGFTLTIAHNRYLWTGTSAVEAEIAVHAPDAHSGGRTWPDVRLRVWAQAGARVAGFRQIAPTGGDLLGTGHPVERGTLEYQLGTFGPGETRSYHLRLVDVGEHNETGSLPCFDCRLKPRNRILHRVVARLRNDTVIRESGCYKQECQESDNESHRTSPNWVSNFQVTGTTLCMQLADRSRTAWSN
jgi:hypothetical protein